MITLKEAVGEIEVIATRVEKKGSNIVRKERDRIIIIQGPDHEIEDMGVGKEIMRSKEERTRAIVITTI